MGHAESAAVGVAGVALAAPDVADAGIATRGAETAPAAASTGAGP